MRTKAVIWDLDGVLIDSEPFYNKTIGDMMRSFGFNYGEAEIAKTTGASYKNIAEMLNLAPANDVSNAYVNALLEGVKHVRTLTDGAESVLRGLRAAGVACAVGSSSPAAVVSYAAEKFGLREYISVFVTGSDCERGKPAPDIFLLCAERLNTPPGACLVIEDSENGVLAAKAARMRVCAYTGTKRRNLNLSGADLTIDSFNTAALPLLLGEARSVSRRPPVFSNNI